MRCDDDDDVRQRTSTLSRLPSLASGLLTTSAPTHEPVNLLPALCPTLYKSYRVPRWSTRHGLSYRQQNRKRNERGVFKVELDFILVYNLVKVKLKPYKPFNSMMSGAH